MIFIWILIGFVINQLVGSIILGLYDTDTSLFEWATTCPIFPSLTFILIVQLWPLMLLIDLAFRLRRGSHDN